MFNQFGQYVPDYGYNPRGMQRYEIVKVNGRGGAEAFQMAPNSEALLLDTTGPIVWLKTTDGAGYPSLEPYTITPYQPQPEVTTNDLLARIEKLEERLNEKSNHADA